MSRLEAVRVKMLKVYDNCPQGHRPSQASAVILFSPPLVSEKFLSMNRHTAGEKSILASSKLGIWGLVLKCKQRREVELI